MKNILINITNIPQLLYKSLSGYHPKRNSIKLLFLWIDIILINYIYYNLLISILFKPLGYSSTLHIAFWGIIFIIILFVLNQLNFLGNQTSSNRLIYQVAIFLLFAIILSLFSSMAILKKSFDFSWLRVEMIKVPLWLRLFTTISPIFTINFLIFITILMWITIVSPKNRAILIIAGVGVITIDWIIIDTFTAFSNVSLKDFLLDKNDPIIDLKIPILYFIMFGGPPLLFLLLLWMKSYLMAFRLVPLILHMTLIGFNHMGILPCHSIYDVIPKIKGPSDTIKEQPGVNIFYQPNDSYMNIYFNFLRTMVLTKERLFVNYGPTCGILSIDRESKSVEILYTKGLLRDMKLSPDGSSIWAVNWEDADFLVINPEPLSIKYSLDLYEMDLATPWHFIIEGKKILLSNVTYPIVAQLSIEKNEEKYIVDIEKQINFWDEGYTKFTDGVFGIYLDRKRNRLYSLVGMLESKYLIGLVELDLDSFEIIRDIRLPAGTIIQPVNGKNTVMLPSYYFGEIYEVSLDDMKLIRTLKTTPNIMSMVYDERRQFFYALSRATGYLSVIEYGSGNTIKKIHVGAKPQPLWLDRKSDQLFLGSSIGIIRIDLGQFFGENMGSSPLS